LIGGRFKTTKPARSVNETPENIANKISRGKFTAVFFLQCTEAIGAKTIHLDPT
jgi:Domain of unknown function (DUF6471)